MSSILKNKLTGLSRRLVIDNILAEEAVVEASQQSSQAESTLIQWLLDKQLVDSGLLARLASDEFGVPLFDLSAFDPESFNTDLVSVKLIAQRRILPLFKRGNRLFVATADPSNLDAVSELNFQSGLTSEILVVDAKQLAPMIDKHIEEQDNVFEELEDANLDDLELQELDNQEEVTEATVASDTPIVRFVNKILLDAIKKGVSDIHFEPYERQFRIRYRIDGILHETARPPVNLANRLAARLKVMARMDISERRVPQDGRIKMNLSKKRSIDFRINTLPTLWGEKVVLRILDSSQAMLNIDSLGFEDWQKRLFFDSLAKSQGMILVTGPTGSGKTVSLYAGLNQLNTENRNIATAEDPVEINMEGINQVQVNFKVGLDFSQALRAFLRQDPDVIMVGEIRDLETAEIAIKAAQTGHLVLSTLHTNSAAETLTRLRNMGVQAFNIASSVSLIIAQRLVRKLCHQCRIAADIPTETLKQEGFSDQLLENAQIYLHNPLGCDNCTGGYRGREGIYEVVPITEALAQIILHEGTARDIANEAQQQGFHSLRQAGLVKVAAGLTSLEEVNRVTKD